MTQGNMGAAETPTPPRVSIRGSCSAVEPTQYSGQYELLHVRVTIDEVRDPQAQFTRPQKQHIHDTVIHEDDDMAEAEDDPLSKLMTKLPKLKKAPLELYWDLRVFGIPPHVPVYITLSDALEMIEGDRMLNISIIQLWYMDTIVVDQGRSSIVIGKSRGQLVQILYPKCNQQLDSWECGFYVMCWIKTIIRAVITDDWNEIPTNSVAVMSDHMIEIASSDGHILPYGVFISRVLKHRQVDLIGEKKIWCTESNEIGKATLRNNGLKKTKDGWVFKDVDETPSTFTLQTEFERFGVDQFRRLSTRISKVERSLIMIHKISDEDNALITPSISDSDDEDDTTKDESMETSNSD
ncbi:hypothetical protein LR48_Vigan10s000900 [Vigna angularis]|uniref:Ubiquitin-like protease family profile domain-containing protein n=1 Tax=Phaseolus angularis TaxID=3914 RepID=A0A0L9T2R8_PHAAN|nr:hypothetical protein LR48_Vigan10s000900 [Vigna angularis]